MLCRKNLLISRCPAKNSKPVVFEIQDKIFIPRINLMTKYLEDQITHSSTLYQIQIFLQLFEKISILGAGGLRFSVRLFCDRRGIVLPPANRS